jgi:hypothetical protein
LRNLKHLFAGLLESKRRGFLLVLREQQFVRRLLVFLRYSEGVVESGTVADLLDLRVGLPSTYWYGSLMSVGGLGTALAWVQCPMIGGILF